MIEFQPHWYVVQSQPRAEQKAVINLQRQGFLTYMPRYLKRRRHARRIDMVAAPLFPRYLFVRLDPSVQRWRPIFSTFGVSRIICNGDLPTPLSDQVINSIRDREDASGFVYLDRRPQFRIGDSIRIRDGVFADHLGLYEGMKDSERVAILLDLLGRKVRVSVNLESVVAA